MENKKTVSLTHMQAARLKWLIDEGFIMVVTEGGRIVFNNDDREFKYDIESFDVTDLFLSHEGTASDFADKMVDAADECYCPECKQYCDPSDINDIDSDFSSHLPNQMCSDCCSDYEESMTDPYTLRGLSRSDFY